MSINLDHTFLPAGSDEWEKAVGGEISCSNTCDELGREAREAREAAERVRAAGVAVRWDY